MKTIAQILAELEFFIILTHIATLNTHFLIVSAHKNGTQWSRFMQESEAALCGNDWSYELESQGSCLLRTTNPKS